MKQTRYQALQSRNRPPIDMCLLGTDEDGALFYALWREQERLDAGQLDLALKEKWGRAAILQTGGY